MINVGVGSECLNKTNNCSFALFLMLQHLRAVELSSAGWWCNPTLQLLLSYFYLLAQFIHLREVPDSCASQGGCVLHQHHLPLVLLHAHHLPVQGLCPDVVEGHVAADVCSRCPPAADCTLSWQLLKPPLLTEVSGTCRCLLWVAPQGKIPPQAEQGGRVRRRNCWELLRPPDVT